MHGDLGWHSWSQGTRQTPGPPWEGPTLLHRAPRGTQGFAACLGPMGAVPPGGLWSLLRGSWSSSTQAETSQLITPVAPGEMAEI